MCWSQDKAKFGRAVRVYAEIHCQDMADVKRDLDIGDHTSYTNTVMVGLPLPESMNSSNCR